MAVSVVVVFFLLSKILSYKAPEYMMMDTFYTDQDQGLIDVICLGSSHAYTSCDTEVYWKDYGIPVYCLSSPGQPASVSYYYFKEALKYTRPRVVLLELSTINTSGNPEIYNNGVAVSSLRHGINRLMVACFGGSPENLKTSLLSNVMFYHDRWKDISKDDVKYVLGKKRHNSHGFNPWWEYSKYTDTITKRDTNYTNSPEEGAIEYVNKICDVCDANGIVLIPYVSPHEFGEEEYGKINWWRQYFKDRNIDLIDGVQLTDELGIKPEKDNAGAHASYYGAVKISSYIGRYLRDNTGLEDHRGEEKYKKWDEDADYYSKYKELFELKNHDDDIDSYLSDVMKLGNVAVIVDYFGDKDESADMDIPGLCNFSCDESFSGVYVDGQSVFEKQGNVIAWNGEIFEDTQIVLRSSEDNIENLIIGHKRISDISSRNEDGCMNIYVFSRDLDECVDIRKFDLKGN